MTETQAQRVTEAEAVAAALQVYADAVRYGHAPTPQYITMHAAAMPLAAFLALADRTDTPIRIVEPPVHAMWAPYARLELPFGAGILPISVSAQVMATCSVTGDAMRRDIATHNAECVDPERHAEGGHDR